MHQKPSFSAHKRPIDSIYKSFYKGFMDRIELETINKTTEIINRNEKKLMASIKGLVKVQIATISEPLPNKESYLILKEFKRCPSSYSYINLTINYSKLNEKINRYLSELNKDIRTLNKGLRPEQRKYVKNILKGKRNAYDNYKILTKKTINKL